MSIDPPEDGSQINKISHQEWHALNVVEEANARMYRVGSVTDESRYTEFEPVVAYYDGEVEIVTTASVVVSIVFRRAQYLSCAVTVTLDIML